MACCPFFRQSHDLSIPFLQCGHSTRPKKRTHIRGVHILQGIWYVQATTHPKQNLQYYFKSTLTSFHSYSTYAKYLFHLIPKLFEVQVSFFWCFQIILDYCLLKVGLYEVFYYWRTLKIASKNILGGGPPGHLQGRFWNDRYWQISTIYPNYRAV